MTVNKKDQVKFIHETGIWQTQKKTSFYNVTFLFLFSIFRREINKNNLFIMKNLIK